MKRAKTLRLVALDLDGTLLRSDGSISVRTRAALADAEAASLILMLVTARPPRRVVQIGESTGVANAHETVRQAAHEVTLSNDEDGVPL